jgi:hypothetical protein
MTSRSTVPSPMARTAPHAGRLAGKIILITGAGSGLGRERCQVREGDLHTAASAQRARCLGSTWLP